MSAGTPSGLRNTSPWASRLPWLVGLIGALCFVRPLFAAPASTILDRAFWWDSLANIDDLIELHRSFSAGPGGRDFWDWLYGGHFFFPQPRPLLSSELMPLAALVSWPLARWPVLAHNLLLTTALVLNCVAAASFARTLGVRAISATIAGVTFAFSSYANSISSRLQLLFLFPLIWALAAAIQWAREGRWRDALLVVGWSAIQALLCLYYATFLAVTLPIVAIVARLTVRRGGHLRDFLRLGVAAVLLLPPVALILWPYTELRSKLGMVHPYRDVVLQSGDLWYFRGADPSLAMSRWFVDTMKWDTAIFPGVIAIVGGALAVRLWVSRSMLCRTAGLLLVVGAMRFAWRGDFPVTLVVWLVALAALVWWARRGQANPAIPILVALALVGMVLFGGPEPTAFWTKLGWSPYHWLYDQVSVVQGLRMVRRAVLLIQLALCAAGALAFSRIEEGRRGRVAVAIVLLFALLEGIPWTLSAQPAATACEDMAKRRAALLGAVAMGDISEGRARDQDLATLRHQATLCGPSVPQGFGGFWPPLSDIAVDAVNALPDRAAHAWLWRAGLHHVELRGSKAWRNEKLSSLSSIAEATEDFGEASLVTLKPPATLVVEPSAHLHGPRVRIQSARCGSATCSQVIDGREDTRWSAGNSTKGGEQFVLRFSESNIAGLEWHSDDHVAELPRGLLIEAEIAADTWTPWAELPSLSPLRLSRNAVDASLAIALPPRRTSAMRITQTGASPRYGLNASEIELIQGSEENGNAAVR